MVVKRGPKLLGAEEEEGVKKRRYAEAKERGQVTSMIARMGRRPWKIQDGFDDLRTAKTIRGMKKQELKRVVRALNESVDTTTKSIAEANMKKILRKRSDVVFLNVAVGSPISRTEGTKRAVVKKAAVAEREAVTV